MMLTATRPLRERWREVSAQSRRLLAKFSPDQPRDDDGKWTSGGAGSGGGTADKPKKPATKDDFDKAKIRLEARGGQAEKVFIDKWNDKIGQDPEEFKQSFMGGLDGTMVIGDRNEGFAIGGRIHDEGGKEIGSFDRDIYPDDKRAYSAYFKLNSGATGEDIGKKMLAGNVAEYQRLGVEKVNVSANIDVGGYAWAKYGYVPRGVPEWNSLRQQLQRKLGGASSSSSAPSRDANTVEADDWNMLSSDVQDDVRDRWMRDSFDDFYNSEVDSWRDSGQAKDDAKTRLVDQYGDSVSLPAWSKDALDEVRAKHEEAGKPIPYTDAQLREAISLDYKSRRGDGEDDVDVTFDDDKLRDPIGGPGEDQMTLPGIEPEDQSQRLTQDMRDDIEKALTQAFDKAADEDAGDIDPPDYLRDSVSEYQDEYWSSMDDSEKLQKAIGYGMADIEIEPDEDAVEEQPAQSEMELPAEKTDPIAEALASNDPKSIWKIADTPAGKRLLLGTSWLGTLDLKDPEAMARFNAYVGKAKAA
jgi:hypothetical protein